MENAIIVRGRMAGARHIELDESVPGVEGAVEVVLRSVVRPQERPSSDVFDIIASMSAGARSKDDIDRQIADERASWGDR